MYSDPNNPDTDYDGISDGIDNDSISSDSNTFFGELTTYYDKDDLSKSIKIDVDYRFDMRYFFKDRSKYNRDLSTISILASSIIYKNNILEVDDNQYYAYTWLKHHGFKDIKDYEIAEGSEEFNIDGYNDNDISQIHIGHQLVTYNGETKDIIAIVVRGTNGTIEEWSSNFDIGNTEEFGNNPEWVTMEHHKGFDIATNRILKYVNKYQEEYCSNHKTTYWITGHSRGAAIANLLSAYLINGGNEVYGYTFASPNTTTIKGVDTSEKYKSIFNIVNNDDFVPQLPLKDWHFSKYGQLKEGSIQVDDEYAWEAVTEDSPHDLEYYTWKSTSYLAQAGIGNSAGIVPGIITGNIIRSIKCPSTDDYNPDYFFLDDTLKALSELARGSDGKYDRNNCYKYTCKCHGDGSDYYVYNSRGFEMCCTTTYMNVDNIQLIPDNAKKYCIISTSHGGVCAVCQTAAFFMQLLATNMADELDSWDFLMTIDVAYKYENAKALLALSSLDGLKHPHYLESYYLLTKDIKIG